MSRLGRYWIFFVIVAVGLALSWGQVGRKTKRALETDPVVFLTTERPCKPYLAPCAAVADDRAVVLGPSPGGLRVKQTGVPIADIVEVEAGFLGAAGELTGSRILTRQAGAWLVSDVPAPSRVLRIRIIGSRDVTVAEFPM
jgi:hypothetical protein